MKKFLWSLAKGIASYFDFRKILKQKYWKFALIAYLAFSLFLIVSAAYKAIAIPSLKAYPVVEPNVLVSDIQEGKIDYIYFKNLDDKSAKSSSVRQTMKIFAKLKTGEIVVSPAIDFAEFNYADFLQQIKSDNVSGIMILKKPQFDRNSSFSERIEMIGGWTKGGELFVSDLPQLLTSQDELSKLFILLSEHNTQYWELNSQSIGDSNWGNKWLFTVWASLNIIGIVIFTGVSNGIIRERELEAKRVALAESRREKVTFKDVAGIDEAKADIMEILEYIKFPEKFIAKGAKMPKGILLVGPPGCGKTLLAKALACEAGVPFRSAVASEFIERYVGVGASRVRDLFREVKQLTHTTGSAVILFIDEIDAIGTRTGGGTGGDAEYNQTIAQVLHEMDGFEANDKVFVLGATNKPEALDPAIRRPGRFDRQIIVQLPDLKGRREILQVHCKNKKLDKSVDLTKVAELTPVGFAGADLANVANEAAIRAARADKEFIDMKDFEEAVEKVLVGAERKSAVMNEEDKWRTAYHESGHALLGRRVPHAEIPQKLSIIPTTKGVGGFTRFAQREDQYYWTKEELLARITVMFGGRIAEELIYKPEGISTGAKEDFRQASQLIEEMICDFGMASDILGPQAFGSVEGSGYLGHGMRRKDYSEETAKAVDQAKRTMLAQCYRDGKKILEDNIDQFKTLARILKEKEVLDAQEISQILETN